MRLEMIEAGEIVSAHGVRGEIKVLPWVESPDFLIGFSRVQIEETVYTVQKCRVQNTCNLIKLDGVDSMNDAEALRGRILKIFRKDVQDDTIFASELIDMDVFSDNRLIGKITDVLDYPGNKVYVVEGEKEYMIPAVKQFVHNISLELNRVDVMLIEGMDMTDED